MGLLHALPLVLLAKCVLSSTMVPHESISNVPSGFDALGSPSSSQEIKLFIALVQSNITGLAKVVDAVSIPSSPSYGQYLTASEVAQYVKPPADSLSAVMGWVTPNVTSVKRSGVQLCLAWRETLFSFFKSLKLSGAIQCRNTPTTILRFITAERLHSEFRPDIAGNTFSVTLLNGAQNLQNNSGGLEGQIDIQYTVGVAGNVPTTYLLDQSNNDAAISYMDTINRLLSQEDPPTVFTTSYANEEAESTLSAATSVCNGYMQLDAIGTPPSTFFRFYSNQPRVRYLDDICVWRRGSVRQSTGFVTSVGGTFFQPPTAFSSSAGGFSNSFPVPSYQAADTSAYLESIGDENSGMYHPNGRGFPDVASEWEVFIVNGQSSGCSGPTGGWNAAAGWDPISGLGTPDFPGMMEALGI
ncbi:hypothetical protein B0H13DRAFT_1932645 [Mycena leptocephala]|nr:hypothetical protein B0H13DRAFT_1932645 [Mycena leptocephala]